MKKRMISTTLAGCLAAAVFSTGVVQAGDAVRFSLPPELGNLASSILEEVDVDAMMQTLEDQLNDADSELNQVVDQIKEAVGDAEESIDMDSLEQLLGSLFMSESGEPLTDEEIEDLMTDHTRPVIEAYLAEKNATVLEAGDAQVFTQEAKMEHETEDGAVLALCTYLQRNYKAEGKDLKQLGSARDTMLFTLETAEDGTLFVKDVKGTEDGENYAASLEALCEAYGTTSDDYEYLLILSEFDDVFDLVQYLDEHPEYERIEYMGELHTRDELNQISDEVFDRALAMMSEANSADDSAEDSAAARLVEDARVSYLGPEGTYTEEAAQFFFPEAQAFLPKTTVPEAIADVAAGEADYAVIPQENTLGGAVVNYVDALIAEENIYVAGEIILPISQTLMGIPGASLEDIKTVCSHAQGIAQSSDWRKENLPDAVTQEMDSTAAAASYVAETQDKSIAAVAAPGAAELYGLSVLAENVQITDANKTRFYVLSAAPLEGQDFTNAVFVASCEANRIDDIILEIHDAGLELVTIHDRPEGSMLGAYNYIIEVENENGISQEQLEEIAGIPEIRCLGSFAVEEKNG